MRFRYIAGFMAVVVALLFFANRDVRRDDTPGDPFVTAEFPESADAGTTQEALITIQNPGPGDIDSLFVTFVRVGPAQGSSELPFPIVDPGANKENPNIVSVSPEPDAISPDAIRFRFPGLAEGETTTITFELLIPEHNGEVANSVIVEAGEDPSRAKGVRVSTQVNP